MTTKLYMAALIVIAAALILVMPTKDSFDYLEIRVNYERGF